MFRFLLQLLRAIPLYPHPRSAPICIRIAQPVSYYPRITLIPSFLNTEEKTVHSNWSRSPQSPDAPGPGSALPAQAPAAMLQGPLGNSASDTYKAGDSSLFWLRLLKEQVWVGTGLPLD